MTDTVTKKRRSEIMASVGQKDTKPEKIVRSFLHRKGMRYRLHVKDLPGKPDMVFPRLKTVLFINGCFWHGHEDNKCKLARIPKSNIEFWTNKIEGNRKRDKKNWKILETRGWRVVVVWECPLAQKDFLENIAHELLKKSSRNE